MTTKRSLHINDGIDDLDPAAVARIERNLAGAGDFLAAIGANPSIVDRIPDGAEIILDFEDDPDLSMANRHAAIEARRAGRPIHVHHVPKGATKP